METTTRMNLRLFDTTTQTTLLPDLSGEMKTFYVDTLIDEAEPELVHDQFGDKYPIPQGSGKKLEFRKYVPLAKALTPLVEGVTPDGGNLKMTTLEAEVEQYGDWTRLSDMLEMTAIDNNIVQATKLHGSQAGRTLDTITRDVLCGGMQVHYAPEVVGDTETTVTSRAALTMDSKLTPDLFFRVAADLAAMNAKKIGDSYVAIVHPYTAYDIMRHPEWIDVHKYANPENIYQGEIGKLAGIRFVETSEAKVWKDDTCPSDGAGGNLAVFATLVLAANAYGVTEIEGGGLEVMVKQKGSAGTADPLNQRSSVGWKATKVAERLVEEYMVRIESLSKFSKTVSAN